MVSGSPVGSTPFGYATPVAAPLPATQGPALSRFIDSGTGDYVIDDQVGQLASMPSLRQRVLLIMNTEFGSSTSLPNLGVRRPAKIDESYIRTTQNALYEAFYRLTNVERIMQIQDIIVEKRSGGRVAIVLVYRDLTSPIPGEQTVTTVF